MIEVARGRLSKQIAGDAGIAEATVKVHRSRLMRKMKARSLPALSRMADNFQLMPPAEPQHSLQGGTNRTKFKTRRPIPLRRAIAARSVPDRS